MFGPTLRQGRPSTLSTASDSTSLDHSFAFLDNTSRSFKQLLATEQTAQTIQAWIQEMRDEIRTIKQQAVDKDILYSAVCITLKLLEEDIAGFKRLLESNESLRRRWRIVHMAAWRATVRPLKVVDLPNEVLAMIFAHFEDVPAPRIQVDDASSDDTPFPSADLGSIKNIRLTCRKFCDAGSRFLLPLVDISFTPSSIQRLEEISSHPNISKGVRIIRIYIGTYSPEIANPARFCTEIISKLATLKFEFQVEASRVQKEVEEACRMIGIPPKPKSLKIKGLQMALAEAQDVIQTLHRTRRQHGLPVASYDRFERKLSSAIAKAHEEYQRKVLEQKDLVGDFNVHASIHAAIRKMPSVQRLCITNSSVRQPADNIRSGWGQRLGIQKFKAILKDTNPFQKLMVDAGEDTSLVSRASDSDIALWYELPLMFGVGDGNLTQLDITIMAFDEPHIEALARHLPSIRHACQQLRRVQVKITQRFDIFMERIKPAFVAQTWGLLDAMLTSPKLEAVRLDFRVENEYHDVHSPSGFSAVLANLPWNNLRHVCLLRLPLGIGDLRDALEKVPGKVHLELTAINLLEGTWAEALEILRSRADASSLVRQPRGVELTQMSEREARYLRYEFDSEHRDGWYSAQRCPGPASFYIQGGNIPNPLIWGNE